MLSARPRSGSFEAGLRGAAATTSSVSRDHRRPSSPRLQRSRSSAASKASPSPERRRGVGAGVGGVGGATMQQQQQQRMAQLEEELRREREEKARAVRELEELRRHGEDGARAAAEKAQLLEREADKSKESERKMLESLIYQTKQLEQTKISLEEAKLEIATLLHHHQQQQQQQRSVKELMFGGAVAGADEEVRALRAELRAATQGEERSRKALDDLSVALSDVTMEAKQVKAWLAEAQAEAEAAAAESARLRAALADAESALRAASAERDRCRADADAWGDKERVLLGCVRAAEEEAALARQENTKLVESQRVIRDENARLRDILKQAVAEATVVKDSLELARAENARLNDAVAGRDAALQGLRQEYECVRVSEAAAQGSLRELNSLLAATATTTACSTPRTAPCAPDSTFDQRLPNGFGSRNGTPQSASRRWMAADKPRTPGSGRRYSIGEPGKTKTTGFSQSARMGSVSVSVNPKDRVFASLSNIADLKSAADAAVEDLDDDDEEFDHIDESHYRETEDSMKSKKKRPIFRKFGDLFRRKSFYKPNLAPVHTL